jgi:hypothetical protein
MYTLKYIYFNYDIKKLTVFPVFFYVMRRQLQ